MRMRSPSSIRPIAPPSPASGETWPMLRPRRAAAEAAVGDERARLAEPFALEERRRVQHLLHAGAAARALVDDHDDVAGLDLVGQDRVAGGVLRVEDARAALELPDRLVDARRLHDAAVARDVAVEHREAAVLAVGVLDVADAAVAARRRRASSKYLSCENATLVAHAAGRGERALPAPRRWRSDGGCRCSSIASPSVCGVHGARRRGGSGRRGRARPGW